MEDERNQTILISLISLICLILIIGIILVIIYYKKPKTTHNIDEYIETDNDNYIWDVEPCNKDRLKYDDKMMSGIYNYNGNEIYLF